jgi:Carboxypeptidase regulatory-like domain
MNRICLVCFLILAAAFSLPAQVPTGTIAGVVTDESGAVVPNAKVTVTNKDASLHRDLTTGADGSFSAAALPAGEYEVRTEAAGFRALVRPATVETGATTTVNLTMQIGATKDVVTVEGAVAAVNYDSNTVQGVVTRKQIQDLPLNGRSFLNLAQLEPGVIVSPANPAQFNAQFSVSILGGPASHTAITMDGANIRNPVEGGTGQNFSQEVVQEFQLSSVNFDLSTGLTSYGAINVVTRSGSNDLHGSGYFFFRDHNMAAYPSLARNSLTNDPFFARRQSGFWVGAPIKKDKLFFFANFEYTNQAGVYVVQPDLPSLAFFAAVAPAPYRGKQFSFKFDYRASDRNTLFLRYTHDGNTNAGPFGTPVPPSNFVSNSNWVDQYTLGMTTVLKPSLVNDVRFSYWYWQNRNIPAPCGGCPGFGGPEIFFAGVASTNVALGNNFNSPQGRDLRRYPLTDNLTWQVGSHRIKMGVEWEHNRGTGYWGFFDPARAYLLSPETLGALGGAASYGLPDGKIHSTADLLKLPIATYIIGIGVRDQPAPFQFQNARGNDRYHLYAQDTWRVTPKFTVNYGLGWVYESNLLNFDLPKTPLLAPLYGSDLTPPNKNYRNFSPAAGFAWNIGKGDRTVIRAGAGIFYDTQLAWWRLGERSSLGPNGRQFLVTTVPAVTGAGVYRYLYGDFLKQLPTIIAQQNAIFPGTGSTPQINIAKQAGDLGALFPKNFPTLASQHFNIGVQHQIGRLVVTADFVYRHTIHQTPGGFFGASVDYNHFNAVTGPVIPKCTAAQTFDPNAQCSNGQISFWYPGSNATYKALLLKVDKRLSRHFQFTASYALQDSQSINDIRLNLFNYNSSYGPDQPRHNLNISGIVELPWGIQASMISSYVSRRPVTPIITGIDAVGSDTSTNGYMILPGAQYGQFLSQGDLQTLVNNYNTNFAGKPTPAATAGISPTQKFPTLALPAHYNLGHDFTSQDLRITKSFRFKERYEFRLIAEGFNIFNFGNLTGDSFILTSPTFGQPQQRIGQTFGTGGPRAFQFAGRFSF